MRVRISAHSPFDVPFLFCADRAFPTKGQREIEVLDQDDDPPEVFVEVKNHTTGQMQKEKRPDQDVMGRKSYRLIMEDTRLSVHETGSVDAAISGAEVAVARAEVARLAAANLDLSGANAKLAAEKEQLLARIAEIESAPAETKKGKRTGD